MKSCKSKIERVSRLKALGCITRKVSELADCPEISHLNYPSPSMQCFNCYYTVLVTYTSYGL
jgi:hypothetical protein